MGISLLELYLVKTVLVLYKLWTLFAVGSRAERAKTAQGVRVEGEEGKVEKSNQQLG